MRYLCKILISMMFFSLSVSAYAETGARIGKGAIERWRDKVEIGVHAGLTDIQANEFVYFGSHKESELIWETRQAMLVGVDVSVMLQPSLNRKLNVSISSVVGNPDSSMDDYDWYIIGADWTHWSHHDNTTLQQGLVVDLNMSQAMYRDNLHHIDLDILLGFKRDQWRWQAVGGSYIYSSIPALRDLTGVIPDVPGITYEQTFNAPYIGVEGNWKHGNLSLAAKIIFSPFVSAEDVDQHHLRNLVFTDTFKGGEMVGGALNVSYTFQENVLFGVFYSFQNYLHNRGDLEVFDQLSGQTAYGSDQAGISLNYQILGMNVKYAF